MSEHAGETGAPDRAIQSDHSGPLCRDCHGAGYIETSRGPVECDCTYGCCALVEGHDGCCVFFCSLCNGLGRLDCFPDDLGCDCGLCDGHGYCQECSGHGFFTEMGEPCHAGWHELAAYGTCDWGGCDQPAVRFRWSSDPDAWLPVCAAHRESEEAANG